MRTVAITQFLNICSNITSTSSNCVCPNPAFTTGGSCMPGQLVVSVLFMFVSFICYACVLSQLKGNCSAGYWCDFGRLGILCVLFHIVNITLSPTVEYNF